MDAENFAEWMRQQGHRIYRTSSSYWYDAGPRVLQAFPYHWLIEPPANELRSLMLGRGVLALRYSTPFEASRGKVSYHVVLNSPYTLDMLKSQARNGVKRGLSQFQIEQIPLRRLAGEGWRLQQDTLDRQNRTASMSEGEWHRLCLSAEDLPGFEAWAATCGGELAAAVLITRVGNTYDVPFAMSHRDYLREHVNNALFYTLCTDLLARPGVKSIFFCLHSLDAPESVDEFKFRMSLTPKPVRQVIAFHPLLAPFANRATHALVRRLARRYPGKHVLAKAEGMLRFYIEGRLPAEAQAWPDVFKDARPMLLEQLATGPEPALERGISDAARTG